MKTLLTAAVALSTFALLAPPPANADSVISNQTWPDQASCMAAGPQMETVESSEHLPYFYCQPCSSNPQSFCMWLTANPQ